MVQIFFQSVEILYCVVYCVNENQIEKMAVTQVKKKSNPERESLIFFGLTSMRVCYL